MIEHGHRLVGAVPRVLGILLYAGFGSAMAQTPPADSAYAGAIRALREGRVEEGTAGYLEALARADSTTLETIVTDAARFFDERELESRLASADGDVRRAVADLWMLRDPTPTTPGNEVLAESFRRLVYVRERYRTFRDGYDDRGRVWLRLGEPDEVVSTPEGSYLYPNESWLYRNVGGKRVVLHFVRAGAAYRLVPTLRAAIPPHTEAEYRRTIVQQTAGDHASPMFRDLERLFFDRASFDPVYVKFYFGVQDPGRDGRNILSSWAIESYEPFLTSEGQSIALSSFQIREDPEGEPAEFLVRAISFEEDGGYETWVVLGYPVLELVEAPVETPPGTVTFSLERQTVLYDADWGEVARQEGTRGMRVPVALTAPGNVLVDGTVLRSGPGSHHLGVRVRDVGSGRLGVYRLPVDLPTPDAGALRSSDILLADRIEPATGAGTFQRRGRRFVPSASNVFTGDRPLWLYFEVYGATPGSLHDVEVALHSSSEAAKLPTRVFRTLERWLSGRAVDGDGVTVQYERQVEGSSFGESLSLDTSALPAGSYRLEVTVRDPETGRSTSGGILLLIQGPGS